MPGGVDYVLSGKPHTVYFPVPGAALPVLKKDGSVVFLPWGRRSEEEGLLPAGGWARHTSIQQGTWARFHPRPAKLPLSAWREKDKSGCSHLFALLNTVCVQGLVATLGTETRVYLVTVGASTTKAIHDRAPRIIEVPKPKVFWADVAADNTAETSIAETPNTITEASASETNNKPLYSWPAGLTESQRLTLDFFRASSESHPDTGIIEAKLRQRLRANGD